MANDRVNRGYIFNGYNSILIQGAQDAEVQAAVVNKQESDLVYVYTSLQDSLPIGST